MSHVSVEQIAEKLKVTYPVKSLYVTQPFGVNYIYPGFYRKLGLPLDKHNGLDIRARMGTPLYACQDGQIVSYVDRSGGVGVDILGAKTTTLNSLKHSLKARYYHLRSYLYETGKSIKQGQLIGYSGNTGGASTGPHLHFAIKPLYFLKNAWTNAFQDNGYLGGVDPKLFFDDNIDLYAVDRRYGKTFNWLQEWFMRFKTPAVHRALIRRGRGALGLRNRELNGLVYGGYTIEEILNPAMWATWTKRPK